MHLYIKGMSQSRKNIIGDLEEKAVPLVEHLVKIIMFQETGNLKHWCDELGDLSIVYLNYGQVISFLIKTLFFMLSGMKDQKC